MELLKKITEELLTSLGIEGVIEIEEREVQKEPMLIVKLQIKEGAELLIGQYGSGIYHLQHLLRLMFSKQSEERKHFIVDINDYRQKRQEYLESTAQKLADKAVTENKLMVMDPASSFDRRLVHVALADDARVETESIGEGDGRRVAIKPNPQK